MSRDDGADIWFRNSWAARNSKRDLRNAKSAVVGLLMVKGIFSSLFYCECSFNQYAGEKTLTDVFGAGLLLLGLSCFRNI